MGKLVEIRTDDRLWYTHPELLHGLLECGLLESSMTAQAVIEVEDSRSNVQFAQEILSFYRPLSTAQVSALLPNLPDGLLANDKAFVAGQLVLDDSETYYCDIENFEILLRFQRARSRPSIEARSVNRLPAFFATWQRFGQTLSTESINEALLMLRGYRAPPKVWLRDLFTARLAV